MVEIPPDPRKHRKPAASNPVGKAEPDHIRGVTKKVPADHVAGVNKMVSDHVAASGKVIDAPPADRRGSPPGVFGQPPHVPTEENRDLVKKMASFGNKHEEIALVLEISEDTLTRHYARELKLGGIELNNKIADRMAARALSDDHKDAQRAGEYWLSRRAGWKETSTHEHTGAGGGPIETRQLPATDEWLKQFAGAGSKTPPAEPGED